MLLRALAVFLFAIILAIVPKARAGDIAIVLSDTNGAYTEFSAALQQFSEGGNWRVRWTGSVENLESAPRADIFVTVGSEATRAALRRSNNAPIIATLIPRPAFERAMAETGSHRPKGSVTAIFLDQPLSRLIGFSRYLMPDKSRYGLLLGSESRPLLPQVRHSMSAAGVSLESEEIDSSGSPVPALNRLLPRSDLLLALPDNSVYRRENVRAILLTSYRFQRPVIGFSQSLVTSGALAAIYSTPSQIARQTMDLVRTLQSDAVSLPPPQSPALFAISVNHNVAQALGLTLPDEAAIRRALTGDKDTK